MKYVIALLLFINAAYADEVTDKDAELAKKQAEALNSQESVLEILKQRGKRYAIPANPTDAERAIESNLSDYTRYEMTDSDKTIAKEAIKGILKDPDSLRISNKGIFFAVKKKNVIQACAVINAKNSYGGYGNDTIATVIFSPLASDMAEASIGSAVDGQTCSVIMRHR